MSSSENGGDIAKYVSSSGSVMTASNYNDVDALVFSTISYVKFENSQVNWSKSELEDGIPMQEFAKKMLDSNNKSKGLLSKEEEALLTAVANSDRYRNCKIENLAACNGNTMWDAGRQSNISQDAQWAAMTINMNDGSGSSVVTMRGTNGTTLGWNEDFELGFEPGGTTAQKLARDYLKGVDADKLYLTGHSKGGNDVSSAYMMSSQEIRDKIMQVHNFDGPGHNPEFIENFGDGYKELSNKQVNVYPQDTVIGKLLENNPGHNKYVHSDQDGHNQTPLLGEHDPYSWGVDGENLEKDKQSELSKLIDKVTDSSLKGLSNSEREHALNFLIHVGLPAMIAGDDKLNNPIEIDASSWNALLMSAMNYGFTTMEELWGALKLLRNLLAELALRGYVNLLFTLPGEAEFILWIKDCFADVFRQFKNWAEDTWNSVWNGISNIINHENNEYHGVHYVDNTPVYDFTNNHQGEYVTNVHVTEFFSVDVEALRSGSAAIIACAEGIDNIAKDLLDFKDSLSGVGRILAELPFDVLIAKTKKRFAETKALGEVLSGVATKYQNAEETVIANISPKGEGY